MNLAVLHLAYHMMTTPDLYGFLGYGDKDTFVRLRTVIISLIAMTLTRNRSFTQRWSFYALGLPYQQAPRQFASTGGFQRQGGEPDPSYFCGHSSKSPLTPRSHSLAILV